MIGTQTIGTIGTTGYGGYGGQTIGTVGTTGYGGSVVGTSAVVGGYGGQTVVGGYGAGRVDLGSSVVGQQMYETSVNEVVQTTGTKYVEVPQMTVVKQCVPEVVEQVR